MHNYERLRDEGKRLIAQVESRLKSADPESLPLDRPEYFQWSPNVKEEAVHHELLWLYIFARDMQAGDSEVREQLQRFKPLLASIEAK